MPNSTKDITEGGSKIIRHDGPTPEGRPTDPSDSVAEEIERHFESVGLQIESVFHELVSDIVHIDVHVVRPDSVRNWWTLFTTGMSDLPMKAPHGAEEYALAEVMLCLPPSWAIMEGDTDLEENYWPIRLLKFLARFPHTYGTWLSVGHTIPNGNPPEPYTDGVAFSGVLIAPPLTLPQEQLCVKTRKGDVHILAALPLHADEMNYKLQRGTDALYDCFDKDKVSEILDPMRPSCVPRKKLFGLF